MVFRDCNSNILNDFKRFFESKTYNCVLYGEFCRENMCPGAQRNSRIRVTASVKNLAPDTFHSPRKYFTNPLDSLSETR